MKHADLAPIEPGAAASDTSARPDDATTASRGRAVALIATVLALGAAAAAGGYLLGVSTGADLNAARLEGAAAGKRAGTAAGAKIGYAEGLRKGRRQGYENTYADAYRDA